MTESKLSTAQRRIIADVNQNWEPLTRLSDKQFTGVAERARARAIAHPGRVLQLVPAVLGIAKEAIRRQLGWQLYDVQLLASHAMIHRQTAEMQTGEGKTIAALPSAIFAGFQARGAHIATTTPYLAHRDYRQLKPVYESLGLTVGWLDERSNQSAEKYQAYQCDITYGTGYEFGFDYLRDQIALKRRQESPLGQQLLDHMSGAAEQRESQPVTRGHFFSIVDEADNVLLDDASSPLVLSEFQPGIALDADAVKAARETAKRLLPHEHYREIGPMTIELTRSGRERIYSLPIEIPVEQLQRPWTTYVETALRAAHQFHRNVHYVVRDDKAKIVDGTTGRIFEDRSWQAGLHQAIEAKEGLGISPEQRPLAQITRQRFFRRYQILAGMTGTAAHCEPEFKSVYNMGVTVIPLRVASRRKIWPARAFAQAEQKWDAITQSVQAVHRQQRPILIGTRTIAESEILAARLRSSNLQFQLLNGTQDADEAEIVGRAGQRGAITIATNLAGRGTDIKLGKGIDEMGGMHVIVTEPNETHRADRQLIGRCARQGNQGSAQFFVSANDWLIQTHGQWLVKTMRQLAHAGEIEFELQPQIRKIQRGLERKNYASRLALLQQSQRTSLLLNGHQDAY